MKHRIFAFVLYCYLHFHSACALLKHSASEHCSPTENIEVSNFAESRASSAAHGSQIGLLFESAEHKLIGDMLVLYYETQDKREETVSGLDFQYVVTNDSQTLSLGYIVALAGDFYANWAWVSTGCVEQISDSWTRHPEQSINLFLEIAKSLSTDKGGYLQCIVDTMAAQEKVVTDSVEQGKDPAQVYKSIAEEYDKKYATCTRFGYAWIAMCNWDHFGIDAVYTYSAGHTAALRQAKKAKETGKFSDLKEAYFLEGFALHYLTDLFSTGHMRDPRRILHRTWTEEPGEPGVPEFWPADRCSQRQHDEDCANGLWVQNQRGDAWPAYGDKQLFTGKSAKNLERTVRASQSGVDEIWKTYQDGIIPPTGEFEALKRAPILNDLDQPPNFVPLFEYHADIPGTLFFRKNLAERNDPAFTVLPSKMKFLEWRSVLRQIDASPQDINMYPFSQSFTSTADTVHFRQFSPSQVAINFYGPLEPGPIWNMRGQNVTSVPNFGNTTWISMTGLGFDDLGASVFSLVGSTSDQESQGPTKATHIGVSILTPTSAAELKWEANFDDGNANWTLVDTVYGTYSRDVRDTAMIKYWRDGPEGANKLELFSIPADFSGEPARVELDWPTVPIIDMFSYRIQATDPSYMLVTLASDFLLEQTMWNFTYWSNGYSTISTYTVVTSTPFPVQTILTGSLGSDAPNNSIIQLYYGETFPFPRRIGVEVVQPIEDLSGQVSLPAPCFKVSFPISWPARNSFEYLLWFLSDVDGDGFADIVGYASSQSNTTLNVVVFPGKAGCKFADPIVSTITIPSEKGTLFTSSFMYPVHARQAPYSYSETLRTEAGILSYFDNYGILGARMIAPVSDTGTYTYEFKGQTPAIAGQLSSGLGWRAQNLTGRGETSEAIGFATFP